jgi:hypothetical protein
MADAYAGYALLAGVASITDDASLRHIGAVIIVHKSWWCNDYSARLCTGQSDRGTSSGHTYQPIIDHRSGHRCGSGFDTLSHGWR